MRVSGRLADEIDTIVVVDGGAWKVQYLDLALPGMYVIFHENVLFFGVIYSSDPTCECADLHILLILSLYSSVEQ